MQNQAGSDPTKYLLSKINHFVKSQFSFLKRTFWGQFLGGQFLGSGLPYCTCCKSGLIQQGLLEPTGKIIHHEIHEDEISLVFEL